MTVITDLPNAPAVVDPNEMIPAISPAAGAVKTTVGRIADYIAGNLVSNLEAVTAYWFAATTAPTLADGKLVANVSTVGKTRTVTISLSIAATTRIGIGRWSFRLPDGHDEKAAVAAIGIARAIHAGGMVVGIAEIAADSNEIHITSNEGQWSDLKPFVWAVGDAFDLSITYRLAE